MFGDLTTLPDVKTWLSTGGAPGTQGGFPPNDDALLVRLITACSGLFRSVMRRDIVQQDWLEIRDGDPNYPARCETRLQFGAWPVTAVSLVLVNGTNIPPVPTYPIPAPGQTQPMSYTAAAGFLFTPTQLVIRGYWVPQLAQSITIQYTAGFAPIPSDLAQACIEMVVRKYKARTRTAERSHSLAGQTVAYDTVTIQRSDITSDIHLILDQYKAVSPITAFLTRAATQTDTATLAAIA